MAQATSVPRRHSGTVRVSRYSAATIVAASATRLVLRPGRPQPCPRTTEDLVGTLSQHPDRPTYYIPRVVEVDLPVTSMRDIGEYVAIDDGVGASLIWHPTLDGDVVGEVRRSDSQRDRHDRLGQHVRRFRRVPLMSSERPTLAPSRPAQPW